MTTLFKGFANLQKNTYRKTAVSLYILNYRWRLVGGGGEAADRAVTGLVRESCRGFPQLTVKVKFSTKI